MTKTIQIPLFIFFLVLFSVRVGAESISDKNKDIIGMVTGSLTGTYIQFGRDIANIAKQNGVLIDVKSSKGTLKNIIRMASKENAGFGIVQSDVINHLRLSEEVENRKLADRLRLIAPLYNEEVHVFAKKTIQSLNDLDGKKVAVGTYGGGTWLTADTLFKFAGVTPELVYDSKDKAALDVLQGDLDAMFFVAGKPVKFFSTLGQYKDQYKEDFNKVHFLSLDPAMLQGKLAYVGGSIGPADYPWLEEKVPTLAVKALLVAFDFSEPINSYYTKRCTQFAKLGDALRKNINQLKATGHKKWQEVDLYANVSNWQQDSCSWGSAKGSSSQSGSASECDHIKDTMRRNICKAEKGES